MTSIPLYDYVNGERVLSTQAMALLTGVSYERVKAEIERQQAGASGTFSFRMPREWARQGNRIRKEVQAALGYEAGMKECIDYLAANAAETPSGGA